MYLLRRGYPLYPGRPGMYILEFKLTSVLPKLFVCVGSAPLINAATLPCIVDPKTLDLTLQSSVHIWRMPLLIVVLRPLQVTDKTVFVAHLLTFGRVCMLPPLLGTVLLHPLITLCVVPRRPSVWSQQFSFRYVRSMLVLLVLVSVLTAGKWCP